MRTFPYETFYFKSIKDLVDFRLKIRNSFMYDVTDEPIEDIANGDVSTKIDISMLRRNNDVDYVYTIAKQYQGIALDDYLRNLMKK
jgi:hypothetical protein